MKVDSKVRHDFINNCLRIEVLNKLIVEALEKNTSWEDEYNEDLKEFLELHKELLEKLTNTL